MMTPGATWTTKDPVLELEHGTLSAAVITLRDASLRRVTLVTALHLAPRASWLDLVEDLRDHQHRGALVLTEGITRLTEGEMAALPPHQRRRAEGLTFVIDAARHIAGGMGLPYQPDVMVVRDAVSADMDLLDVVARHGAGLPRRFPPAVRSAVLRLLSNPLLGRVLLRSAQQGRLEHLGATQALLVRLVTGVSSDVMLEQRNRHAVEQVLGTGRDVVTVWGADHVASMVELLEEQGFEVTGHHWRPVFTRS